MARLRYDVDATIPAERFMAALTDFSERRPTIWPGLSASLFNVHELGATWADVTEGTDIAGGVWARERYDWSTPGVVTLTLIDSADFQPGTITAYRVTSRPDGCHIQVDFHRIARSLRGRLVGVAVQSFGARRFADELATAVARLGGA
jgi:hypothetical protein